VAAGSYTVIGSATRNPWRVEWTLPAAGNYHLRAIAATGGVDFASETLTVTVAASENAASEVEKTLNGRPAIMAPVRLNELSTIHDGRGGSLKFPMGARPADDTLIMRILETTDTPNTVPGVSEIAGSKRELSLFSGETSFARPITLRLPYRDDDDNGVVDGTSILVDSLAAYIRPTGGAWRRIAGATVRRGDKVVEVVITHHSVVGLGGPGDGLSSYISVSGSNESACLLTRIGVPGAVLCWLRTGRDLILGSAAGRLLTGVYYLVFG